MKKNIKLLGKYNSAKLKVFLPLCILLFSALALLILSLISQKEIDPSNIVSGEVISTETFTAAGSIGPSPVSAYGEKVKIRFNNEEVVEVIHFASSPCLTPGQNVQVGIYEKWFGIKTDYKLLLNEKY